MMGQVIQTDRSPAAATQIFLTVGSDGRTCSWLSLVLIEGSARSSFKLQYGQMNGEITAPEWTG